MKILFYGSCNAVNLVKPDPVGRCVMNFDSDVEVVTHQCHDEDLDVRQLQKDIKTADFIVTQPIRSDYRGKRTLGTSNLLAKRKAKTPVAIFPPIVFDAYFPDYSHLFLGGVHITQPLGLHIRGIRDTWEKGEGFDYYLANHVNNPKLYTTRSFADHCVRSLEGIQSRESLISSYRKHPAVKPVMVMKWIKANYKKIPVAYTVNHPSRHTFAYIGERVAELLAKGFGDQYKPGNIIDRGADPLCEERFVFYNAIQRQVSFATSLYPPVVRMPDGEFGTLEALFHAYCSAYDELKISPQ